MSRESKLQTEIAQWLRSRGCYVMVIQPQAGIPTGCPDIIALYSGGFIALEVKKDEKSHFQPLQRETLAILNSMQYAQAVWFDNWPEIKQELASIV